MTNPSDPTPEHPGMEQEPATPGTRRDEEAAETDGQVSEVSGFGETVSDGDSVHGSPSTESGSPDTGAAGPESVPPENKSDNDFKPRHRAPDSRVDDL